MCQQTKKPLNLMQVFLAVVIVIASVSLVAGLLFGK